MYRVGFEIPIISQIFLTEYFRCSYSSTVSHLITNCIIYYNTHLLSHLLTYKENAGDGHAAAGIKQVSPVAWQHINLYGRYEFNPRPAPLNIETIIQEWAQRQIDTELAATS